MTYATAHIKKGEARALKAGGLWIYDNEISGIEGEFENGDIVSVEDFDGFFLGYGFINMNSKIRIRLMIARNIVNRSDVHGSSRKAQRRFHTAAASIDEISRDHDNIRLCLCHCRDNVSLVFTKGFVVQIAHLQDNEPIKPCGNSSILIAKLGSYETIVLKVEKTCHC